MPIANASRSPLDVHPAGHDDGYFSKVDAWRSRSPAAGQMRNRSR
jgi:hypothetical protein